MRRNYFSVAALALILSTAANAQQTISNTPDYSDAYTQTGFGVNGVPTIGQTFTVPAGDTYLTSFTFYLANDELYGGGADLLFKPYLMAWSSDHPTGVNLLPSAPTYSGTSSSTFQAFEIPGGVAVTPGNVYVAFLATAGIPQNGLGFNQLAGSSASGVNGQLVYAFNSGVNDLTTAANWSDGGGAQLAFQAQFRGSESTVPEPSEFILLGSGLTGLVGFVRVRRKQA